MVLVWGVCYTPQKGYPCDRIFSRECKNRFLGFLLLISDLMLAIFTQTSSVTKRNIMDGMNKVLGTAYTPHQCSYSDRKSPFWEKSPNNDNMGVMVIIWCTLMHVKLLYNFWELLQFLPQVCDTMGPHEGAPEALEGPTWGYPIPVTKVSNGQGWWADLIINLILTKDSRPPSQATSALLISSLGLINTCCNRNGVPHWGSTQQ